MIQIFLTFLKLGMTSFGGPIAHLGFFHGEFVARKKWISENEYIDVVALCQLLPGPASSQVGMAIGFYRGGILGSLLAWIAFTLPSAALLISFALTMNSLIDILGSGWLHGLKIAAVAVVAQAVWEMGKKFCSSLNAVVLTLLSAACSLYVQNPYLQVGLILAGGIVGVLFFNSPQVTPHPSREIKNNSKLSLSFLVLFFVFLFGLPFAAAVTNSIDLHLASIFYRVGALVFGGGHVVLPLIQASVVDSGLVTQEAFIAGYGVAQAIPGPLFSLSAYLGFIAHRWPGALTSLIMIFTPSFFLIIGVLPYWEKIRSVRKVRNALMGVNAVVVGLLLAALIHPLGTTAIFSWKDIVLALAACSCLIFKKAPNYVVVAALACVTAFPYY